MPYELKSEESISFSGATWPVETGRLCFLDWLVQADQYMCGPPPVGACSSIALPKLLSTKASVLKMASDKVEL